MTTAIKERSTTKTAAKKKVTKKKAAKKKATTKKVAKKKAAGTRKTSPKKTTKMSTKPSKLATSLTEVTQEERWKMIAVAAYHKAEKRGFAPGNELHDWAEAEKEIDKLMFG